METTDFRCGASLVERVVQRAEPGPGDWNTSSVAEIIDHIRVFHHARLGDELADRGQLIADAAREYGATYPDLTLVQSTFNALANALRIHLRREASVVFPLCRRLAEGHLAAQVPCGGIHNAVRVMALEHEDVARHLAAMRALTDDYRVPYRQVSLLMTVYRRLDRLDHELGELLHLESDILYPRVERLGAGRCASGWHR